MTLLTDDGVNWKDYLPIKYPHTNKQAGCEVFGERKGYNTKEGARFGSCLHQYYYYYLVQQRLLCWGFLRCFPRKCSRVCFSDFVSECVFVWLIYYCLTTTTTRWRAYVWLITIWLKCKLQFCVFFYSLLLKLEQRQTSVVWFSFPSFYQVCLRYFSSSSLFKLYWIVSSKTFYFFVCLVDVKVNNFEMC